MQFKSDPLLPADLTVRPIEPADLPQLVALCAEHAAFEQAIFVENGQAARWAVYLFGPRPAAYCLIVARLGQVLGFATYMPEFSTWDAAYYLHLDCLFLRPELRGQGMGQQLLQAVVKEARQLGCTHLQWQTPAENAPAIRFYQRRGAQGKAKLRFSLALV